ncbi:Uncharacterised protein [Chlamydia trachomatis]|nr:Uncharacterised protein [Chlamydia trachomatis]
MPVDRGTHVNASLEASSVGIQQELRWIIEEATIGIPRAISAETVTRAHTQAIDMTVPNALVAGNQRVPRFRVVIAQNTEINVRRQARHDGNVKTTVCNVDTEARGNRVRLSNIHERHRVIVRMVVAHDVLSLARTCLNGNGSRNC